MSAVELVSRFCTEWPGLPPAEIGAFFTPDGSYQHSSLERPLVGPRFIAGAIEIFRARFEQIDSEVLHISSCGSVVLVERRDRFWLPGGRSVQLQGMARVEVRDGKIAMWRDYFDVAALVAQVDVTEG